MDLICRVWAISRAAACGVRDLVVWLMGEYATRERLPHPMEQGLRLWYYTADRTKNQAYDDGIVCQADSISTSCPECAPVWADYLLIPTMV